MTGPDVGHTEGGHATGAHVGPRDIGKLTPPDPKTPLGELLDTPWLFDFDQAVRLLERVAHGDPPDDERAAHGDGTPRLDGGGTRLTPVGEGGDPAREAVQFSAPPSLAFPSADLLAVTAPGTARVGDAPSSAFRMAVTFLGLVGPQGPLPTPYAESVVERTARRDAGTAAFLDLLHHRVIALFYRARQKTRVALGPANVARGRHARVLRAAMGLGLTPRGDGPPSLPVPDALLLHLAGLLARRPRTAEGLRQLVAVAFDVPVRVRPLVGRWRRLDAAVVTVLGARRGTNNVLGHDAIVGRRVWDQQAAVAIEIGPLTLARYRALLPGAPERTTLDALVRLFLSFATEAEVRLTLRSGEEVPAALSRRPADAAALGWTTWLAPHPRAD